MKRQLLLLLFIIICCTACQLGPPYTPPSVPTPAEWKGEAVEEAAAKPPDVGLWWQIFQDETLNCLQSEALSNSPNLFAALDRVAQARAIAGIDKSALYPQISLNPTYSNTSSLFKIFLPPGLLPSGFIPQGTFENPFRVHMLQYTLPVNLSYELDLWGKLRGQYNSGVREAQAQAEDFFNVLLTLTTDVASNYYQLRALDNQLDLLDKNLELIGKNLSLVQNRFNKGLIDYQQVVSAQQQYDDTAASIYDYVRQRTLLENVIATLIGTPASSFHLARLPLTEEPPLVPAGLPSAILLRRPDISAAERHMAAQHALIGVAYANFLPSIQLTGTLGYLSPDLKHFLSWKSRLWSLGASAAQSIFDGGANRANLNLAYAQFNEVSNQYKQTALQAFQEVEDALANVEYHAKSYGGYKKSDEAAAKRLELSNNRYVKGLGNYLDVLDSERTLIQADVNTARYLGLRYVAAVQLIKALGGSWETAPCE